MCYSLWFSRTFTVWLCAFRTKKKQKSFIIKTQPSYNFIILCCKVFGCVACESKSMGVLPFPWTIGDDFCVIVCALEFEMITYSLSPHTSSCARTMALRVSGPFFVTIVSFFSVHASSHRTIYTNSQMQNDKKKRTKHTKWPLKSTRIRFNSRVTIVAVLPLTQRFFCELCASTTFDSKYYSWPFISLNFTHSLWLVCVYCCCFCATALFMALCMSILWPSFVIGHERSKRIR